MVKQVGAIEYRPPFVRSALRLLVIAAVMIVLVEVIVSVAVSVALDSANVTEHVIEPILLSLGTLTVLYIFLYRPVTSLKDEVFQSAQSLAESHRILETTLASTPGIAYRISTTEGWPVLIVGGNLVEMLGSAIAQQLFDGEASLWACVHGDDRQAMQETIQHAVEDRAAYYLEGRLLLEDGNVKWVGGHGYPVLDEHGALVALEGVLTDITTRKQTEQEIRELNALYDSLLQTIPLGIDIVDETGTLLYINRALRERFGDTVLGQPCWRVLKDDQRQCAECPLRTGIRCGETVMTRVDQMLEGCTCLIAHTGMLYHGKPALLEVIQDISSQRCIEESLARSRDYYLQLFEEFPTLIWRSGLDAKCNYFNKTWLAFTGRTLEQEVGDGWVENVHPEDVARCVDTYLAAFAAREPFDMEYRLRSAQGEYRWIADYGRPFYDPDGKFAGFVGSCYDITERKQQTEQLDYLATHDALTGLHNRRVLESILGRAVACAKRGIPSALLFIDLDHFKEINDTQGHHVGDQVLVSVTRLIRQTLREGDLLVRLGGDEFAVLLEGISLADVSAIAERMRASVADHEFHLGDRLHHLSLSIGMRAIDGSEDSNRVLSQADMAMYQAKSTGRNRVVIFQESAMPVVVAGRRSLPDGDRPM